MKRMQSDEGFTLIELLTVMVILGVLSGIGIPVFLGQQKKAVDSSLKSDLRRMALAQEAYLTDNPQTQAFPVVAVGDGAPGATGMVDVGGPNDQDFKASPGNAITVALNSSVGADAAGYCVWGVNGNSSKKNAAFYYSSTKGGLMPRTVSSC